MSHSLSACSLRAGAAVVGSALNAASAAMRAFWASGHSTATAPHDDTSEGGWARASPSGGGLSSVARTPIRITPRVQLLLLGLRLALPAEAEQLVEWRRRHGQRVGVDLVRLVHELADHR